jgi:hypothetical protein
MKKMEKTNIEALTMVLLKYTKDFKSPNNNTTDVAFI